MSKSDDPNHNKNHKRIRRNRGSASGYICKCGSQAQEWAQTHGTDGSEDEHFTPLCRKCHKQYDYELNWGAEATARRSAALKGKGGGPRSEETKARMRMAHQNCRCPRHQNRQDEDA